MAKRRHGGLGRGLDALIPQKPWKEPEKEEKKTDGIEETEGSGSEKDSGTEMAAASESRDEGSVLSEVPSETAFPEAGSVQKSAGGNGESDESEESGEAYSAAVSGNIAPFWVRSAHRVESVYPGRQPAHNRCILSDSVPASHRIIKQIRFRGIEKSQGSRRCDAEEPYGVR